MPHHVAWHGQHVSASGPYRRRVGAWHAPARRRHRTGRFSVPAGEVCGETRLTIGLDPSEGMLRECRKQSSAPLVQARGEALPFPDGYFDMVSTGYGLRHVGDLNTLFREYPGC